MKREQIKSAVLKATGNPESGVIRDFLDEIVEEVFKIDQPEIKKFDPVKETR